MYSDPEQPQEMSSCGDLSYSNLECLFTLIVLLRKKPVIVVSVFFFFFLFSSLHCFISLCQAPAGPCSYCCCHLATNKTDGKQSTGGAPSYKLVAIMGISKKLYHFFKKKKRKKTRETKHKSVGRMLSTFACMFPPLGANCRKSCPGLELRPSSHIPRAERRVGSHHSSNTILPFGFFSINAWKFWRLLAEQVDWNHIICSLFFSSVILKGMLT